MHTSLFQRGRYSALLSLKEKRCRQSHGVRVEPVWGLLVIIAFISGHRWPAQSYHLPFRTKKSKNWQKSATSWLQSWERLTEFPLFAQWICVWLLPSWPQLSCLTQELLPLCREKHLEKAHAHCYLSRFAADAQPWKNPGALRCRRRSGSWSPHSTAHGPVGRLLSWVCDFSVLICFFLQLCTSFVNIFSHHTLPRAASSPILQRFPLPHTIHFRGI